MPLLLELFSGTGSVGRAFAEAGWEVLSLDGNVSSGADVRCDILQWDPPEGLVPDHVHASPPCTEYSLAKTTGVRNLELADAIVQKTLAILELLRSRNPKLTFSVENPWTGMLKSRDFMSEFNGHMRVVNYCKYGLRYKKTTAVWTNLGVETRLLGWTETYEGIKNGVVESVTSPVALVESMRFYEVAPNVVRTNEFWQEIAFMVNARAFKALSKDLQTALLRAHKDAGAYSAQLMQQTADESMKRLADKGVKVTSLDTGPLVRKTLEYYNAENKAGRVPAGFFDAVAATKKK
jgi:site-specific DNA-cytosine methylase